MSFLQSEPRLKVLDAFRGLAILAVVAFHIAYTGEREYLTVFLEIDGPMSDVVSYGWVGVEFFFIISGFVIFMTLQGMGSLGEFVVRRFARVWPGYFVSVVVITLVIRGSGYFPFERSDYDLLIAPFMWAPAFKASYVSGVYWSLIAEVRFYVLISSIYFLVGENRFIVAWLCLSLVAVSAPFVYREAAIHIFESRYLPFFTMGIVFYRMRAAHAVQIDAWLMGLSVLSVVVLWSIEDGTRTPSGAATIPTLLALPIVFWFFVRGRLDFLAVRPLLFLGRISYAVYLLHFEIALAFIWRLQAIGAPPGLAVAISLVGVLALATAMTFCVEDPAKRAILAFRKGPTVAGGRASLRSSEPRL